jgi:amino acid transporter
MFLGLGLIALPLVLFGMAATRYVPAEQLGDPTALTHMTVAIALLGDTGKWWMGIVSIAATISTLNALLAGIPRLLYGMSHTQQAPRAFGYLLPSTRAPVVGIAVMALIPILMNVFDAASGETFIELVLAGVLGWATAYILIHISLIILRLREPAASRPFRSPLFPVPEVRDNIYRDYLIFLGISVVIAFVYNAFAMRSIGAQFRPIPLREVYSEVETIEAVDRQTVPPDPAIRR